jgi:hypothetical protein
LEISAINIKINDLRKFPPLFFAAFGVTVQTEIRTGRDFDRMNRMNRMKKWET